MSHEPPPLNGQPTFAEPDHYSAPAAWGDARTSFSGLCARHDRYRCPVCYPPPPPQPPPMTPSEVALAKVLAAWEEWPGRGEEQGGAMLAMCAIHETLYRNRLISPGDITEEGAALLDRARKAGVVA